MLPSRPWTTESLARLCAAVLICAVAGSVLGGFTQPASAAPRVPLHWLWLLAGGGIALLLAALAWLLRRWSVENFVRDAAVLCVLVFIGLQLALAASKLRGTPESTTPTIAQLVIATLAFQGAGIGLVAWFLHENQLTWNDAFGILHRPTAAVGIAALLVVPTLGVMWLLQAGCALGLQQLGYEPKQQQLVEILRLIDSLPAQIYLGFAAIVLAPLCEELLFRGILYPTLKRFLKPWLALWGTSLIFAAIHANAVSFVPLLVFALFLAVLYDRTENLLAPITAHACFNLANLVALQFVKAAHAAP